MLDFQTPTRQKPIARSYRRHIPKVRSIRKSRIYRKARYIIYKETIVKPVDLWWAFLGSFLGIGAIGITSFYLQQWEQTDRFFLIGSFGASAVLVYGSANSPLAQPRNVMGGHVLSAIIGVTIFQFIHEPSLLWLAAALAVSLSIVGMIITKTLHPPGGATALIAIIGSEKIKALGYSYVFSPVLVGVGTLLVFAFVVNNIPAGRSYPYKIRGRMR